MPLNLKKSDSSFTGLHALLFLILCAMFYHPSLWCCGASEWKVPTTFIYGFQDWMNYQGAQEARKHMKVPCEIIRVPQVYLFPFPLIWSYFIILLELKNSYLLQGGHFAFIDNPTAFHSAVFYACGRFLTPDPDNESLPQRANLCIG